MIDYIVKTLVLIFLTATMVVSLLILKTSLGKKEQYPALIPQGRVYHEGDLEIILPKTVAMHYARKDGKDYIVVEIDTDNGRKVQFTWLRRER